MKQNNKKKYSVNQTFDQAKKQNQRRIVNSTLLLFLPIFSLMTVVILAILGIQERLEMKVYQSMEESIVNSRLENIQAEILHVTNDLMILTLNSQMEKLWDSSTKAEIIESLTEDFLNVAVYRKLYDQVRLIDENGKEIIRVNFNNGNPAVVPREKLQNKKDRYYFYDAFKLNKDEVFVSPLDLNIEYGEIEQPLKPMIRFATPVFDRQGIKRGIILLNYFGQTIINQLVNLENPLIESRIMLLNVDGYWFKGQSSEYEWGFMYEDRKDITFKNIYADAWDRIESEESSQFETQQGMFTFRTVYPLIEGHKSSTNSEKVFSSSKAQLKAKAYYWKIVSYVPSGILYAKRNIRRKYAALLLAFLSMSLLFISWRLAKAQYSQFKAQQALKESEERQRLAQNAGRIGIWEWNVKTDSIIWSDMTYKIFGLQKTKKIIKSDDYFNHVHPDDKQRLITELDTALKNKKDNHRTEYRVIKNNKISWIDETSRITTDETGKFVKMIGVIQDITDRKKAEQELQENEVKLKESNKTKDKFFSIIAHDLKSPFTSVLGFSELLVNNYSEYDTQQHKEFIGIIHQGVQNIHKLLENLLLWSRAQSGIIDYKPEKENLYLLTVETIELLVQAAANKSISIKNEIPENVFVNADKNMLLTILRNLLSNAIKFTPKGGGIVIGAHTVTKETNQSFTEISVKDNGVGISPEIQSGLFKIAENVSTKGTENEQGTGLGLILCKEFVEKHGGKIWVESKVGNLPDGKAGGSEFKFTILLV